MIIFTIDNINPALFCRRESLCPKMCNSTWNHVFVHHQKINPFFCRIYKWAHPHREEEWRSRWEISFELKLNWWIFLHLLTCRRPLLLSNGLKRTKGLFYHSIHKNTAVLRYLQVWGFQWIIGLLAIKSFSIANKNGILIIEIQWNIGIISPCVFLLPMQRMKYWHHRSIFRTEVMNGGRAGDWE